MKVCPICDGRFRPRKKAREKDLCRYCETWLVENAAKIAGVVGKVMTDDLMKHEDSAKELGALGATRDEVEKAVLDGLIERETKQKHTQTRFHAAISYSLASQARKDKKR